jgi:hypothetical protein
LDSEVKAVLRVQVARREQEREKEPDRFYGALQKAYGRAELAHRREHEAFEVRTFEC